MNNKTNIHKIGKLFAVALAATTLTALPGRAAPPTMGQPGRAAPPAVTNVVNYTIRVEWKRDKGSARFIQLVTSEGSFQLNASQPGEVEINKSTIPITINLNGELSAVGSTHALLSLFLGRTVPYATESLGSSASNAHSYQQRQEGLNSRFVVTFGKPLVIQKDPNGEVSVLVTREEP